MPNPHRWILHFQLKYNTAERTVMLVRSWRNFTTNELYNKKIKIKERTPVKKQGRVSDESTARSLPPRAAPACPTLSIHIFFFFGSLLQFILPCGIGERARECSSALSVPRIAALPFARAAYRDPLLVSFFFFSLSMVCLLRFPRSTQPYPSRSPPPVSLALGRFSTTT